MNQRSTTFARLALASLAALLVAACASKPPPPPQAPTPPPAAEQPPPVAEYQAPPPAPTGPVPGSQQDFVINVGELVYFDFDKADIRADAQPVLGAQAAWLQRYPAVKVRIEGNCDERGTEKYNLSLGERRALAAREYLGNLGVNVERIKTVTYGKSRPVDPGHNEAAWKQNRRDDFVLVTQK